MQIDKDKMRAFMGKMIGDMGAAAGASLVVLGDKLGLFKGLAIGGAQTSQELADRTSTHERYVREWASAQAAAGYIEYDASSDTFSMTPEQIAVLADESSKMYSVGGFYGILANGIDEPLITEAFRTGEGVPWGDHHECLFCGTAKFFRPGYEGNLLSAWIPSLDGVEDKLKNGAKVADVGCGHGHSTMILAKNFPNSTFVGFDYHAPSVGEANVTAKGKNLKNLSFEVATAKEYPGTDYDVVAFFDCLHDMGDPQGACEHVLKSLKSDGHLMLVEPFANDNLEDNLNPIGRMYYSFSTMVCTPNSLSQEVGLGMGAQAGEKRLSEVILSAGFKECRKAMSTDFNLIIEARP